jgi:23S rRNA (uracil1939-C5)-methyltransferase
VGEQADIRVEKWVYGGGSLSRVDGRVVLAPFLLPGESARIELPATGVDAKLVQLLEPAPERVPAPCPIFGRCGGCHYQHAPYEFQLARKVEILREQLKRVGKIEYAGEIGVLSGPPFGYRNRIQLHIENGRIGYLAARSHELVEVKDECPVASPRLNQCIRLLRERVTDSRFPKFLRSLELFTNETEVQINALATEKPLARRFFEWMESAGAIEYATKLGTFRVSPHAFFQVNRFLIEALTEAALGDASGGSALDLYAGVGLFSVPLARRFAAVTAVEAGSAAARDLDFNASAAGVQIDVRQSRVEDFLARLESAPDFVVADPPRAGLGKEVTAALNRLAPKRVVIVSCDPATLARDLAALSRYRIERMTLVDLFPQTYHLETVVDLQLDRAG